MQSMKLGARPGVKEPRMLMRHTDLRWRMWLANLGIGLLCARRIEVENDVSERVNCRGFDPTPLWRRVFTPIPHPRGYFKQRDNLNHSPPVDGGGGHAV